MSGPANKNITKGTQVQSKPKKNKPPACPWLCNMVPKNVSFDPAVAQAVLHPNKDVFVLKVNIIGTNPIIF